MKNHYRKLITGVACCLLVTGVGWATLRAPEGEPPGRQDAAGQRREVPTTKVRNPLDPSNLTPLMLASLDGDYDAVRSLLAAGANVNETGPDGTTPLMCAAARGHTRVLELLLGAGGQVDLRNRGEQTALLFAAKFGQTGAAKLLVASGADVNAERHRLMTPKVMEELYGDGEEGGQEMRGVGRVNVFAEALTNNHPDLALYLLESGASPKVLGNDGPDGALRLAARKGYAELVDPLLSRGAAVDRQSARGRTALMEAAGHGRKAVIEALLKQKASVELKDTDGLTALMLAARAGNAESAEALLKHGARPDEKATNGKTALMIAAEKGNLKVADLLLKSGADREAKDPAGKTAAERAQYHGHADLATRLSGKAMDSGKWPN